MLIGFLDHVTPRLLALGGGTCSLIYDFCVCTLAPHGSPLFPTWMTYTHGCTGLSSLSLPSYACVCMSVICSLTWKLQLCVVLIIDW